MLTEDTFLFHQDSLNVNGIVIHEIPAEIADWSIYICKKQEGVGV